MSFKNFGLVEQLLRAIAEEGYTEPTPVQQQAIPIVLGGHDMLVCAQTGTGKTAGFTLPMLNLLMATPKPRVSRSVRALILTPTRELAVQVEESVRTYGKNLPLRSTTVYGGVSINTQMKILRNGVDILVATPGRLLDVVSQRAVDLSNVEFLVLDEADRMLDMGFIIDIRKIISHLPKVRQNLLFCATFSKEIERIAEEFLTSPKLIEVAKRNTASETIAQTIYPVDNRRKRELLAHLITSKNWKQVLVFTRTKHGANRLSEQLEEDGFRSTAIHGNKTQAARAKALAEFKRGAVRVLVATDVAARGIDIDKLPNVVNYELPNVAEDYVHRIGRTGRAGCEGEAVSLVCVDELKLLRGIEGMLKRSLPREMVPGFEVDPSIRAQPIRHGGGGGGGGNFNRFPRKGGFDRKPSFDRGSEGRSYGGRPAYNKGAENQSSEDLKPSYDRGSEGGKSYGRPAFSRGGEGKPSYPRRGDDRSSERKPFGARAEGRSSEGRPAYGARSEGRPSEGRPAYGARSEGRPSEGRPAYGARSEGRPSEGRPAYGARSEGRPAFGARSEGRPAGGRPSFGGRSSEGRPSDGRPPQRFKKK